MKILPICAVISAVALSGITLFSRADSGLSVCEFQPVTTFNPKLPASHIQNQCARYKDGVEEVSWLSWLAGKSPSFQFHFLDLLELLHSDDASSDFSQPTKDS
jgi:hypothetical protein